MRKEANHAQPPAVELRLGEALRLLRLQRELTMSAAAKLEGAPKLRTLSRWESRRESPAMEAVDAYVAALGAGFGELLEALEKVEHLPDAVESPERLPRFRLIDVS